MISSLIHMPPHFEELFVLDACLLMKKMFQAGYSEIGWLFCDTAINMLEIGFVSDELAPHLCLIDLISFCNSSPL